MSLRSVVTMSTIVSVKKIKLNSEIPVYDIEVPKNHNFVLESGVVVHNSKDISDALAGAYWDALQYKDEYLYWSQSDVDYEGVNTTQDEIEQYIENFKKDITANAVKTPVNKDRDNYSVFNNLRGFIKPEIFAIIRGK